MGKYLNTMINAATMYQSAVGPSKKPGTKVEGKVADPNELTAEKAYGATTTDNTSASDAMQGPRPDSGVSVDTSGDKEISVKADDKYGSGGLYKTSPYKMGGMSWKEGQTPVKNLSGVNSTPAKTKASPAKEPITLVIAGAMVVGAAMDYFSGKSKAKKEAQMFNVNARNEAKQMNRKHELLAMDKKSKSIENFADTARAQSQIYAQGAASKKFS